MATKNPFVDNSDFAEVWELRYVVGFVATERISLSLYIREVICVR
jgi:hypothetical protein